MSFALTEPKSRMEPTEVAPGTFVIHEVQHALGEPLSVFINSLVVDGKEPLLVDTGSLRNRRGWLEDAFSLVDPARVKWVFISHEDADHVGNLNEVMDACPDATLVCSWALVERYANAFAFPLERCRWMDDGASFDAGDRRMIVVRPPTYDAPTTRGLFDAKTGVYWASDCFATPVPGGEGAGSFASEVGDLDQDFWEKGMAMFAIHALSPWLRLVDRDRFAASVRRLSDLPISTIASAHSPAITAERIEGALAMTCDLPTAECGQAPDQSVLDLFLTASSREPQDAAQA
jgi:flavorubredoxin